MTRSEYDAIVGTTAVEFSPRRVLKKYEEMTLAESQSHIIKLDTIYRRQGLEHRQAPADNRGRVYALAEQAPRDQVQVESDGLLRGLRRARRAENPDLLRRQSCLAAVVARKMGLDKFVMVSSPCCDPRWSATSCETSGLCSWTSFRAAAASAPRAGEWTL